MEDLLKPCHLVEDDLITNLRSSGISKSRAEEQLFLKYSYFINMGEKKFSLSREELFDAYSDTVLAVIHSISQRLFKNRSSLKTFIYEIYHNKCVDLIRKKTTKKNTVHKTESITDSHGHLSDTSISIIEKLINQSDLECIRQKMLYLSEKYQLVLLLSADGYTDKEIAAITKFKTADVVKTCRLRGLKKLRALVS